MAKKEQSAASVPADPTAAYLAGLGVEDADLDAPDISEISVDNESPATWVDKNGDRPPDDIELYRLDTTVGEAKVNAILRSMCRKIEAGGPGWKIMPAEAGFRWVTGDVKDQIVLYRSRKQKAAHIQVKKALRRKVRKDTKRELAANGQAEITVNTKVRERAATPPLRD